MISKESNTVWRVSEEDVRGILNDKYPHMSDDEVERIVSKAHEQFMIHDWVEQLDVFINIIMIKDAQ